MNEVGNVWCQSYLGLLDTQNVGFWWMAHRRIRILSAIKNYRNTRPLHGIATKCDHSKKRPNETKMDYPTVFIQHWRLLKYFEFDLCCCCLCCYFFPIHLSRDCFPQQRRGRPLLLSMFNAQESRGCIIWYRILRGTEEDTLSRFIATFA